MNSYENPRKALENKELLDEHSGASYYPLLEKLPKELRITHAQKIDAEAFTDEEAYDYLEKILAERKEATTISVISDEKIKASWSGHEEEVFAQIETDVFLREDNYLGSGKTARVKHYEFPTEKTTEPIAVKYLVSPTEKTLSAAGEHDMIKEVERIQTIEDLEEEAHLRHVKVPHPYFHHRNEHIQCYGMEEIDGLTLEQGMQDVVREDIAEQLARSLTQKSEEEIFDELEIFFERMHKYCLHGDMKPANIMVNTEGVFYIIDFGQSVLVSDVSEKDVESFENLKEAEIREAKLSVQTFLKKFLKNKEKAVA